jgi:hypothetical protein
MACTFSLANVHDEVQLSQERCVASTAARRRLTWAFVLVPNKRRVVRPVRTFTLATDEAEVEVSLPDVRGQVLYVCWMLVWRARAGTPSCPTRAGAACPWTLRYCSLLDPVLVLEVVDELVNLNLDDATAVRYSTLEYRGWTLLLSRRESLGTVWDGREAPGDQRGRMMRAWRLTGGRSSINVDVWRIVQG